MRPNIPASILTALLSLSLGCTGEMVTGPGTGDTDGDDTDGDTDGTGDDTDEPQSDDLFEALSADLTTSCGSCHIGTEPDNSGNGPDFLGPTVEGIKDALLAYRSYIDQSPLVGNSTQNSRLYVHGSHTGPALPQTLATSLAGWIQARAIENGIDPGETTGVTPATLVEALTLFGNCMQYTDFQSTQFQIVANQTTTQGSCYSCHQTGTGGAYLALDPIDFYTNLRQMPYILKFALGTVNTDGTFKDLVPAGRFADKQADNEHPAYTLDPAAATAMDQFYDLTKTHYQNAITTGVACVADNPVATP